MQTYHSSKSTLKAIFLVFILGFFSLSCQNETKNDPTPVEPTITFNPTEEGGLVSFEKLGEFPTGSIKATVGLAQALGLSLDAAVVKYDVVLYKIEYKVKYKGNLVTASGLLALPVLPDSRSIPAYSFQHGTILLKSEAPTIDLKNLLLPIELYLPASMGMMAVLPDYIGFGSSASEFHPYYVKEPSALAVLDLLQAAKNFSTQKKYKISEKLHLVGYSQGGYTTLAAHQYMTSNPNFSYFKDFISYAAAGGYDLLGMQDIILKRETYEQPYYLGYILKSYQNYYGFTKPTWSDLLKSPYAEKISTLIDGTKSGEEVNAALTNNVKDLFTDNFLNNYANNATFTNLTQNLVSNSLTEVPSTQPLIMYHGKSDVWVFPETSKSTYNKLLAKGSKNISYIEVEGNHSTGFVPFANDVFKRLVASMN